MLALATNTITKFALGISLFSVGAVALADGWDPESKASAIGSIANTRHNLTLSYNKSGLAIVMDIARNNYGAVCVYCHTPHGANKQIQAPLWNRTVNPGNYTIYDKPTTLMRPIGLPGPNSLTCLSCHDGTIAIDSILNMPGSGGYGNRETGPSDMTFLDTWAGPGPNGNHFKMGDPAGAAGSVADSTCTDAACHATSGGAKADFRSFVIGTDLRDDHPIGVQFPTTFGPEVDFNEPNVKIPGKWAFFDVNGNNHADKNEVRLYDSGEGPEVECASCHDPHGIPSNGAGTRFNPSFLRVNNGIVGTGLGVDGIVSDGPSELCLTCHAK
jgi:hypothetical protein